MPRRSCDAWRLSRRSTRSFLLGPDGTDPLSERYRPPRASALARAGSWPRPTTIQERFEIVISSLARGSRRLPARGLPLWHGELRSGARANVLMGVASNRVDIKQAAAPRRARPRTARRAAGGAAHDSQPSTPSRPCGSPGGRSCATRPTTRSAPARTTRSVPQSSTDTREAAQIAEGVTERALKQLASSLSAPCHVAVNPFARSHSAVIELILGGSGPIEGAQILDERVGLAADLVLTTSEVRGVLAQTRLPGPDGRRGLCRWRRCDRG